MTAKASAANSAGSRLRAFEPPTASNRLTIVR
jgi:hypothetical protein